jgi:hypothetical protein
MLDDWNAPPTAGKLHIAGAGTWTLFVGCMPRKCAGGGNEQQNETNQGWEWWEAQYAGGLDKSLMLDDWNAPPTAGK